MLRDIDLNYAKRVLRYMSGTMDYNILHKLATPIQLEGHTDADWASYKADKQTINLRVRLFPQQRRIILEQQKAADGRTIEQGATVTTCEAIWLKRILKDLGIPVMYPLL